MKNVRKKRFSSLLFCSSKRLCFLFGSGIDSCIQQKQWIDEKDFEILGSQLEPQSNGCQASRIRHEKNVRNFLEKVFTEFLLIRFCLSGIVDL